MIKKRIRVLKQRPRRYEIDLLWFDAIWFDADGESKLSLPCNLGRNFLTKKAKREESTTNKNRRHCRVGFSGQINKKKLPRLQNRHITFFAIAGQRFEIQHTRYKSKHWALGHQKRQAQKSHILFAVNSWMAPARSSQTSSLNHHPPELMSSWAPFLRIPTGAMRINGIIHSSDNQLAQVQRSYLASDFSAAADDASAGVNSRRR